MTSLGVHINRLLHLTEYWAAGMEIVGVPLGDIVLENKVFEGINFPILCPGNVADHLEKIRNLKYRPGDVYIMSYPRSGTHWVREIVAMLLKGKAEYIAKDDIDFPLELLGIDTIEKEASPRVFYSHMPFRYLPLDHLAQHGKVIGCFRNPKDVVTSSYHFLNSFLTLDVKWNTYFDVILEGNNNYGCWFDWRDRWKTTLDQHADNLPLTITYEETSRNLPGQVRRIAQYLGVTYTDTLIDDIAHACEFKNMRDAKSKKKANMMERIEEGIQQSDRILLKDIKENIGENSVIRKGIVGDWKSLFTSEQTDRFNTLYRQRALPSHPLEFKEYLET